VHRPDVAAPGSVDPKITPGSLIVQRPLGVVQISSKTSTGSRSQIIRSGSQFIRSKLHLFRSSTTVNLDAALSGGTAVKGRSSGAGTGWLPPTLADHSLKVAVHSFKVASISFFDTPILA